MKPLTAAQRKANALSAYDAALSDPDNAKWQLVAVLLRACVSLPKAKAIEPVDDTFAPWHDDGRPHKLRKGNSKRTIRVVFVDGRETLASASDYGTFNVGRAVRVACTMYRHQMRKAGLAYGPPAPEFWHFDSVWDEWRVITPWAHDCYVEHIAVAEILSIECETTGERWDPVVANRESASYRAAGESLADRAARIAAGPALYAAAVEESRRMRKESLRAAKSKAWPRTPFARRLLGSVAVLPSWPSMAVSLPVYSEWSHHDGPQFLSANGSSAIHCGA